MTDNTQLDEILLGHGAEEGEFIESLKQAILDWHNKQVEAVLDRLDKETERCQDGCWVSIEDERNKLEGGER